jgi:hypothetical protein
MRVRSAAICSSTCASVQGLASVRPLRMKFAPRPPWLSSSQASFPSGVFPVSGGASETMSGKIFFPAMFSEPVAGSIVAGGTEQYLHPQARPDWAAPPPSAALSPPRSSQVALRGDQPQVLAAVRWQQLALRRGALRRVRRSLRLPHGCLQGDVHPGPDDRRLRAIGRTKG